jgi:redox-sensitive bicupin YhaK (pirin superfamily)
VEIKASSPARLMLFGGARVDGDRHIWWNFVASSRELMEAAKQRWRERRFPPVPDETEFIPLPDDARK